MIENNTKKHNKTIIKRGIMLAILDVFVIIASMIGALWIRFDCSFSKIEPAFLENVCKYMGINILCTLILFLIFKMYVSLWRFASAVEMRHTVMAVILSTVIQIIGMYIMGLSVPRSYSLLYMFILMTLTVADRFIYRFARIAKRNYQTLKDTQPVSTMIVGAGAAGYTIIREMKNSKHMKRIIPCIIDDDISKHSTYLLGIPIVGGRKSIPYFAEKYNIEEIVIAIPTISDLEKKDILEYCQQTSCKILILPGIYQLVGEEVNMSMLRQVDINDLLGRPQVVMDMNNTIEYVKNKVVLVTGCGSIGSEICRQIAMYSPKKLVIFDVYENNAYDIRNELIFEHPELDLEVLIGSIRDKERIDGVFEKYKPDLVFHAAAHKHVPLMEDSPNEAVKNNILGTWNIAAAADKFNAQKMILISSDKAVRPTNIMGASKRVCELIVQSFAENSKTIYSSVRFGNVLGSNGSVVPLFKKQIERGGPVTVTHPDMIRYFMTIPEAVNLVLQCGALSGGGEVFILDMGEPVKILNLAEKMIRMSGLKPGEDIKIEFTGLRPGEKLYEELIIDKSSLKKTEKERIFVVHQTHVDSAWLAKELKRLIDEAETNSDNIKKSIQRIVSEYRIFSENDMDILIKYRYSPKAMVEVV